MTASISELMRAKSLIGELETQADWGRRLKTIHAQMKCLGAMPPGECILKYVNVNDAPHLQGLAYTNSWLKNHTLFGTPYEVNSDIASRIQHPEVILDLNPYLHSEFEENRVTMIPFHKKGKLIGIEVREPIATYAPQKKTYRLLRCPPELFPFSDMFTNQINHPN